MHAVELQQTLVVSSLLGDARVATYCRFVQDARRLSQQMAVHGALLFDGELALHLIEGPAVSVDAFVETLYGDVQAQACTVLASQRGHAALLPPHWCTGYTEPQGADDWCAPPVDDATATDSRTGAGPDAIARFLRLLATVDCE